MRSPVHRLWWVALLVFPLCLSTRGLQAQFGFDDTFDDDPFASGDWISNSNWGGPSWVPEGAPVCANPNVFNPLDPCTVDENYDGYVLITDPVGNRGGNFFRAEPDSYDNFKLTVEVELRDGSIGRPADGMVVVVVGGDRPPGRLGTLGGGMGAPCVGGDGTGPGDNFLPQLAWEFDNWSCNTGDSGTPGVSGDAGGFPDSQWHHVAFSYSATGFPCTDAIQPQAFVPFRVSEVPLHNYQPPPAQPNRFRMTVFAQRCGTSLTVACDLEAIDQGKNLGRVYTHVIEDYEPFEGFLGVTASTGGAWQNHILHSAKLEELPAGFCLQPTGEASRSIAVQGAGINICGDYEPGSVASVSLVLGNIRQVSECCAAATSGRVVETVPAGWTVSGISHGGTFAAGTITWNLSGANFTNGTTLTYTATAPGNASGTATFSGNTSDGLGGVAVFTKGDSRLLPNQPFDACGRIKCWNILGAFMQTGGNNPGIDAMRQDYLSDGSQTELDFVFEPGAEIAPDFFGAAASTGIFLDPMNRNPDGASGIATVFKFVSPDGWINLNDAVFGGNPDNVMAYAQIYVISDADREVFIASDSDDSIQIILNEEEVWINSIPRGNDSGCPVGLIPPNRQRLRDVTPGTVTLLQGENRLIVKTFEGGGAFNFEVRFEDAQERPVTQGLSLSHTPLTQTCRVPPALVTRSITTGREVNSVDVWSSTDSGPFSVSLRLSDLRVAGGACAAAGTVTIVDTVPSGWTPSNPSAGGTISGREVRWTLTATDGATLTYNVTPGGARGDVTFSGVLTEPASDSRFGFRGERLVRYAPPLLARDQSFKFINTDFDDDEGFCPDGWTCNFTGPFQAHVNQEGRLQLACAESNALCGTGATSVLWNEPLDLEDQSFTATFEVYMSHPGGAPADALTFVVLDADNPLTMSFPPTFLGLAGGCNGYCNLTGFAVEFDLWNNGPEPSGYNNAAAAFTHVGVTRDGQVLPHVQTHLDVLGSDARPTFLGGAGWPEFVDFAGSGFPIMVEVDYNNGNLQVFIEASETSGPLGQVEPAFPRTKVIDTILTFPSTGDEPVLRNAWLGFTAGTGGAIINASVDNLMVTVYESGGGPVTSRFVRGDADSDGTIALTDAVRVLNFLFLSGPAPLCMDAADADDSGTLSITDAIRILGWLFTGGPAPPAPSPPAGSPNYPPASCGVDPTPDELDCRRTSNKCSA
jgi:hypothetical protein